MAALGGELSAALAGALKDEASGPVGNLLPIPSDGADETIVELRSDITKAKGKTLLVEAGDWGGAPGGPSAAAGWEPRRLGAEPPPALVSLMTAATNEVYAACGLSGSLFSAQSAGGAREAWRQMLYGVVAPLGKLVSSELTDKLETSVSLTFDELRGADITGRARAYQSLVGAQMEPTAAARLTGLQ